MKDKSFAIGSTLAAFLASLCCLGPLLLGGAGLGAVLVATFAPLRPYFLGLSAVLLAGGFYFVYRKPKTAEACAGETCAPQSQGRKLAKTILWLATVAVAALAFFPTYGKALLNAPKVAAPAASVALQTAELKITGMDCPVCAGAIQRKLMETRGVVQAEVRYPAGSATVKFDAEQTDTEKLIAAVSSTGYKASVQDSGQK